MVHPFDCTPIIYSRYTACPISGTRNLHKVWWIRFLDKQCDLMWRKHQTTSHLQIQHGCVVPYRNSDLPAVAGVLFIYDRNRNVSELHGHPGPCTTSPGRIVVL